MNIKEICVPDIGDFKDVDVIDVLVASGDSVEVDDALITLESDKASMDIPAPASGMVKELKVGVGDKVSEGSLILLLEMAETGRAKGDAAAPAVAAAAPSAPQASASAVSFDRVHASPSVRRIARERGLDLNRVSGSGRKGRITQDDLERFAAGSAEPALADATGPASALAVAPSPAVDHSKFGEVQVQPLTKIKRLTGINLSRAWLNVPHVTHHDETDITDVEAFRKSLEAEADKQGLRVTLLSFFMKACAATLRSFPTFNASLDSSGENLVLKRYCHIGIAVDTPNGLVVPVVRDVDRKSIFELSAELSEISSKARDKKLMPGDMQGGSFTISSLGGIGGTAFTPIVNAPEVAILGLTRSQMKPVWNGAEFLPRLMQPLSLSYDHRVIDGAEAARFVRHLGALVSDVRRLLL